MGTLRQRSSFGRKKEDVKLGKSEPLLFKKEDHASLRTEVLRLAVFSVIFRVINCFLVQSSFIPDEYWQSVEVAHHMAFNYGHLTWEWKEGIRGFTYPLFFAAIYKILHWIHCDSVYLLESVFGVFFSSLLSAIFWSAVICYSNEFSLQIWLPRQLQALITAFADFKFFFFLRELEDRDVAKWTFFCHLCSWYTWYSCSRTLTNSVETTITSLALCYFPLPASKTHSSKKYLSLVAFAIIVRPTALIVWLPLLIHHFWQDENKLRLVVHDYIPIGASAVVISTLIDRIFYEKWIFVHFNFLNVNVLDGVANLYGTHPWHWYLTQGFPVIIGPHLLFFFYGCFLAYKRYRILLVTIAWTIGVYSLLPHKEFRFIYPVLPFCMIFCGASVARMRTWRRAAASFLLASNLLIALYTGLIHQRGALDIMSHIHALCRNASEPDILFAMSCHSTPYYSHVHCPLKMRFLECPPDLGQADYVNESDRFNEDPLFWLQTSYPHARSLPTHVILFDVMEKKISAFLGENNYTKTTDIFHTHFPEGGLGRRIFIYERRRPPLEHVGGHF
ncbi:GPI mannosyltransferase 3-like isoform X2 [Phyllopteryx taeniolatus]|uniref:GPI mannosyltransferase 3-like isoform X2 n=1 Tax=Phyllopteryx taeniolatus TaxID=161469 RepID=UPI002AD4FF82|nr:GPI mannosyltransferase 3-like isoform X2 [Phyllopteryx taeniolatus]